jgi:hypothetical protein
MSPGKKNGTMKILFIFLILISLPICAYSQVADSLALQEGDSLETIISDTSIVYRIKRKPVVLKERVEISRAKKKKYIYQSFYFSLFQFSEYKKANASYEEYLSKVNTATTNELSYSIGTSIWQCPKKIYTGIGIDFIRLNQKFHYTSPGNQNYKETNRFNYAGFGFQLGYWLRKEKKASCIIYGKMNMQYLLTYSGFTYGKPDSLGIHRLKSTMLYQKYIAEFSLNAKFLFTLKTFLLEVEPYCSLLPMSATPSNESYSLKRTFVGLRLGFTQKLF